MAKRWGESGSSDRFRFSWAPESLWMVTAAMKLRRLLLGRKGYDEPRQHRWKQSYHTVNRSPYSQSYGFSSSHIQMTTMLTLGHKEGWALKNWCFWIVVLEKTFESPLDCKEIRPADPKADQSWIFIGRTDAKAPTLWPPDVKSCLTGKDPDSGKDWGQEEKWATEDELVE